MSECQAQKHPHGRGEDSAKLLLPEIKSETPPRTWGRRAGFAAIESIEGNTPTDVGKTDELYPIVVKLKKHPHGRGEDLIYPRNMGLLFETPPRTWGRLSIFQIDNVQHGNTPTDVGKTVLISAKQQMIQKHPHGRGEDPT